MTNFSSNKIPWRIIAILLAIVGIGYCFWAINTKVPEIDSQTSKMKSSNESLEITYSNLN
jgi:hypothetical protein